MVSESNLELQPKSEGHVTNMADSDTSNNLDLTCYGKEDLASMVKFMYIFSSTFQCIIIITSIIGVVFNATGIYILSTTNSMKNTFNFLLVSLYCFDSLFLASHLFMCLNLKYNKYHGNISIVLSRFVKLLYSVAFNASIFLIVGISHERYIAMRHPLMHHQLMESKKSRRLHFFKYFLPIIFVSVVLVVPEYLDVELVWKLKTISELWGHSLPNQRYVRKTLPVHNLYTY